MVVTEWIEGGVCAAEGFTASGIHVGVKTNYREKRDLALIVSERACAAAAVYTKNVVKAAPLLITQKHLEDGRARAIIANSGNANACAPYGEEKAERMCALAAKALGIEPRDVLVASTGVIGQTLPIDIIEGGIPELARSLSRGGSLDAAHAIMTTDTVKKEYAVQTEIGGKTVHLGGIAKGSGMIYPNMGTLLCFVTTDCAISSALIKSALIDAVNVSFNRISVDGDTSTNDTYILMANGLAGNAEITSPGPDYDEFVSALKELSVVMAKAIASDGEGATHLITCRVSRAKTVSDAETLAKSVISSTLMKAAIFGADANWGRVLCAMGYSGVKFDPDSVDVAFESNAGRIDVCSAGRGIEFDEETAKKILTEHDVTIDIALGAGESECTAWGCDITYDYIKINGDYRT